MIVFKKIIVFAFVVYSVSAGSGSQPEYCWSAGAASVEITPRCSIWLAGYAARDHPSEGVANPIFAKALVLKPESGEQLLILNAELLFLPRGVCNEVAARLRNKYAIPRRCILFAATHSHSAPVIEDRTIGMYQLDDGNRKKVSEYTRRVEDYLFQAAEKALSVLSPARITYGHGTADFAVNRRKVNEDDPVDHDVPVLKVEFKKEKKQAVVFSYACHNTTLDGYRVCGDYSGFAQSSLEKDNDMTALFITGCAADCNPSPRRTMEYAEAHGSALASSVECVFERRMNPVASCAEAAFDWVQLPLVPVPSRKQLQKRLNDGNVYERICARRLLEGLDSGRGVSPVYSLPVQAFRLGRDEHSFTVVAIGGEVVVDYAIRIKREFGERGILVAAYTNDAPGYIPSERVLDEGGYEGGDAMRYFGMYGPWARGIEKRVMDALYRLLSRVNVKRKPLTDLSGRWRCALDPGDAGEKEKWYTKKLKKRITLPGSLTQRGFGDPVSVDTPWTGSINNRDWFTEEKYAGYRKPGDIKVPFWLQPETYYKGAAWYQREITVPASWKGKHIELFLERVHWRSTVWIDAKKAGASDSLSTPHRYDAGSLLTPGAHTITVRVDNRMIVNVGPNSHSVSDHTQGNWNGIAGTIELRISPCVSISDIQVYPDVEKQAVAVKVRTANRTGKKTEGTLRLRIVDAEGKDSIAPRSFRLDIPCDGTAADYFLTLTDDAALWDAFSPHLYTLKAVLSTTSGCDSSSVTFGMRNIAARGTRFMLNGSPVFFRGTLECCIFPLTGYPSMDVKSWKRIIRICKSYGLNHIRFHSHCPPEAAFVAADELGFYYQVECASWANQGAAVGDGKPLDTWLYKEASRIIRAYGNHPSFLLMAYGNEPAGRNRKEWLGRFIDHFRSLDRRRLYTSGAGWPLIPQSDFHNTAAPRIQAWGQGLGSRINSRPPETKTGYERYVRGLEAPVISHEIGQWCAFPDFDEIPRYTGVMKPKNFDIFRDLLKEKHMEEQARDFLMASGGLQLLCYKEEIESALRTEGFGGFQLLDLHDFPGQGTALVGVLDPFWNDKPYVHAKLFRRFCNNTVLLAGMEKRTFLQSELFTAELQVYHFGPRDLPGITVYWKLTGGSGEVLRSGKIPVPVLKRGGLTSLGPVSTHLAGIAAPQKLMLHCGIEKTEFENSWDVWVYPGRIESAAPEGIVFSDVLSEPVLDRLRSGGKVLLAVSSGRIKTDVIPGFSSIFWNTLWTGNQAPHTLGIVCDPGHPAFSCFPTDRHTNWQWWELLYRVKAFELDSLPHELKPVVQMVPDWHKPKKLGLLFEAEVAGGSMMLCSMDIHNNLGSRHAAAQLRKSLFDYMKSSDFDPEVRLSVEQVRSLFRKPSVLQRLGASVEADSSQGGHGAASAIDNNPSTIWHTRWEPVDAYPHELVLDLKRTMRLKGMTYLPRQDMANGRIAQYEVYVKNNKHTEEWRGPVAAGVWKNTKSRKTVLFRRPVEAGFLKLRALREVNGRPYASASEIGVVLKKP